MGGRTRIEYGGIGGRTHIGVGGRTHIECLVGVTGWLKNLATRVDGEVVVEGGGRISNVW